MADRGAAALAERLRDSLDNAIALAVDDILAILGVPMTDTVGGRG